MLYSAAEHAKTQKVLRRHFKVSSSSLSKSRICLSVPMCGTTLKTPYRLWNRWGYHHKHPDLLLTRTHYRFTLQLKNRPPPPCIIPARLLRSRLAHSLVRACLLFFISRQSTHTRSTLPFLPPSLFPYWLPSYGRSRTGNVHGVPASEMTTVIQNDIRCMFFSVTNKSRFENLIFLLHHKLLCVYSETITHVFSLQQWSKKTWTIGRDTSRLGIAGGAWYLILRLGFPVRGTHITALPHNQKK
jgi:hypothetical protein